jgi:hypothetical protein
MQSSERDEQEREVQLSKKMRSLSLGVRAACRRSVRHRLADALWSDFCNIYLAGARITPASRCLVRKARL